MIQYNYDTTPTIFAILNVRNIAEESKNNHFSR